MQSLIIDTAQSNITGAQLSSLKNAPRAGEDKSLRKVAEDFESVFISQMIAPMMETVNADGIFSGGHAEKVYRSMMVDEFGKSFSKSGGLGIADQVYNELLKLQEV